MFPNSPIRITDGEVAVDLSAIEVPAEAIEANGLLNLAAQFAEKVNKAWEVVSSADESVTATAADSGKYYRLSHANPTFNLPTTDLVVGETEFWLTLTGAAAATGTVDAGADKTIDKSEFDISDSDFTGSAAQTATPIQTFQLIHIKYVATDTWASNIRTQIA